MGPLAKTAVPVLKMAIGDINDEVKEEAKAALARILGIGFNQL
jgi:hypothetical protein